MNPWTLTIIWLLAVMAIGVAGILLPQRGPTLEEAIEETRSAFQDLTVVIKAEVTPVLDSLLGSVEAMLKEWDKR